MKTPPNQNQTVTTGSIPPTTQIVVTSPETLSVPEAAQVLGISRGFAYQLARTGEIAGVPVIRIGRRMIVSRAALDRVLSGTSLQPQGQ